MNIHTARSAAAEWVLQEASRQPDFLAAYYSGSTAVLPEDALLPPSSDVDIIVVTVSPAPPLKLGKFRYNDVLLEVTHLGWDQLYPVQKTLSSYHLAHSLRINTIIADPSGQLLKLQQEVERCFARPDQIRLRVQSVLGRIRSGLDSIDLNAPLHNQIMAWLFATGVTTHAILVAALCNPTIRLRYMAARDVLSRHGLNDYYEQLLRLLGCAEMSPQRAFYHLDNMTSAFDAAAAAAVTPFFFSSDVTAAARPIAVDGSRQLIRDGNHREAVFWMTATFARCHHILAADAPESVREAHLPAFRELIADLGIVSLPESLLDRAEGVRRSLPQLAEITEHILSAGR
ncbi:hypothetical protein [Paenibacillus sp. GCM10027626]|uniref:hypothetical protein n=1 Tax=Paenibacillus sp. GCM10027626 TaxID=3273411 RepID=UPI003645A1C8